MDDKVMMKIMRSQRLMIVRIEGCRCKARDGIESRGWLEGGAEGAEGGGLNGTRLVQVSRKGDERGMQCARRGEILVDGERELNGNQQRQSTSERKSRVDG